MYVRIARFEGGSAEGILKETDEMRADLEAVRRGEQGSMPPELTEIVSRIEVFIDPKRGSTAMALYCETEEQIRRADSILDAMSPSSDDMGRRVSADIYEVAIDEAAKLSRAA